MSMKGKQFTFEIIPILDIRKSEQAKNITDVSPLHAIWVKKHLNDKEYQVLRLSYGLDCEKHSANKIAEILNIEGSSAYVRVSELKKQAVQKLIDNVDHSQVLDYL